LKEHIENINHNDNIEVKGIINIIDDKVFVIRSIFNAIVKITKTIIEKNNFVIPIEYGIEDVIGLLLNIACITPTHVFASMHHVQEHTIFKNKIKGDNLIDKHIIPLQDSIQVLVYQNDILLEN